MAGTRAHSHIAETRVSRIGSVLAGALVAAVAVVFPPEGVATAQPSTRAVPRPNVVVIMVDDMRQDDLRYMPSTRRLIGARGVRFVNSFSPSALCCPARASVLTGLDTHNHGVLD